MKESKRNLNHDIKADKVQVITDWWENLWIMKFSDALERAEDDW
jgi:translation initiation factor IF-3